ncbi:MMPL family transporter [Micrococcus luteus]
MAQLLYRLGITSARRPFVAIIAWVLALTLAVGSFLAFGGTLSSAVTIPNTPTAQLTDRLQREFPEAAKGSGSVVFATEDGSEFTRAQRQEIAKLMKEVEGVDVVDEAQSPFALQKELDDAKTQVTDGREQLSDAEQKVADGKEQVADGRKQLSEGEQEIEENQAALDEAKAELDEAEPQITAGKQELDAAKAELDTGRQELDAAKAELDASRAQLDESKAQLDDGRAQLDASKAQLDDGQAQLDAAKEQAIAQGLPQEQVEQQFAAQQAELDAGRQQYEQGLAQWQAGQAEYEQGEARWQAGKAEYDQGEAQWQAAKAEYDQGLAQWEAGKAEYDQGLARWQQGQEQLDAGRAELESQKEQLAQAEEDIADGERQIAENRPKLERGERTLALTEDYRAVSEKGDVAMGRVVFGKPTMDLETEQKEAVTSLLTQADIQGVDVHPDFQLSAVVPQVMGPAEVVGLVVAAIVLVVMLGSLAAAGLPLLNALVGVGVGVTGALAFSGVVEMMSVTPVLGIMLGLAVGIDYALFIVNRHRHQLKAGMPVRESIGLANGTSGNAVVFAGLTVIIALAALNVTGIPFLGMMGTVAASCVAIAVLIAVTLTPALLSLIGPKALSGKERARVDAGELQPVHGERPTRRGRAKRTRMSTGTAVATALAAIAALALIAIPFGSMRLGLPDGGSEPVGSDSQVAYTLTGEAFGDGYNGPLVVTADLPRGLDQDEATDLQLEVAEQVAGLDHVRAAVPAALNEDRTLAMIQVIPEDGPNAVSTEQLVQTLRVTEAAGEAHSLAVAGVTSGFIDVSAKLSEALPLYLSLVVGLSLVIMVLVFRSLLVPLIATGGFILSVFAAMGAVVAIYQWGWLAPVFGVHAPGPVLSFLPTIMIGVLFGLAMDYQLFIASGMREAYAHGTPARESVLSGLRAGRSVVIAAAIIMVSVFGGFIFADDAMIRPIGFGLTVGVLFDAFVVRLLLMPAVMHLLGPAAWWLPRWLDRILPDVDVEGAKLERDHEAPAGDRTVTGEIPQTEAPRSEGPATR